MDGTVEQKREREAPKEERLRGNRNMDRGCQRVRGEEEKEEKIVEERKEEETEERMVSEALEQKREKGITPEYKVHRAPTILLRIVRVPFTISLFALFPAAISILLAWLLARLSYTRSSDGTTMVWRGIEVGLCNSI